MSSARLIALVVLRRLGTALLLLAILSLLTFALLLLSPGGPEQALLGDRAPTPETLAAIREQYLLDEPFAVRYAHWVGGALTGDLGTSIAFRQPVVALLGERLPVTATLAGIAILLTVAVGIPAGLAAAARRGRLADQAITLGALTALSFPSYALALVLLYVFAAWLGWFPVYGSGTLAHYVLPAIALALGQIAILIRQTRAAALDVGSKDYITFAQARGLPAARIWLSYWARNAALPILTVAGLLAASNLAGAVFIEQTFSLPGLGSLLVQSVLQKDIPLIQALVLLGGGVVILVNLVVDIAGLAIDPRIRQGARA